MYYLYILKCADETLYTGITVDLARRVREHNDTKLGAKYTRARRPVELVYSKRFKDRSKASKEEYRIKQLSREEKLHIINNQSKCNTPRPGVPGHPSREGN
jgi:putative endonuclease